MARDKGASSKVPADGDCPDVDIYRDTPLRYLGYANELGESFRPIMPALVVPSYMLSFGYVLADTVDKSRRVYAEEGSNPMQTSLTASIAFDTLVWQSLASVIFPGLTINRAVSLTSGALKASGSSSRGMLMRWGPTAVGLGVIPLIIHPLDAFTHYIMDHTSRPFAYSLLHGNE